MRLSFAAPVLKGGHEVIVELRDHNAVGEKGASAPEPPRRAHHASTQPVGKGLVMKKILSLTFVAMLSVALAAPAYAGRGHGGGFHGGHHNGFHHGGAFHRGCCWGGAFVGGVFVGSAFAYPYYGYPYYAYPYYASPYYPYAYPMYAEPAYQPQTQVTVAPSVQRDVCYTDGCYHLQGDGVTVAYSWVWVPAAPAPPAGPPSR